MRRSIALGLFALVLCPAAQASDAHLVLGRPDEVTVNGDRRHEAPESLPTRLEFDYGNASGDAVALTVPTDGLVFPNRDAGPVEDHYPRFELIAPATGELRGVGDATTIRIQAEVWVTVSPRSQPKVYDVVLTAEALENSGGSKLDVYVEGWSRDAPEGSEPTLRAVLPAAIE